MIMGLTGGIACGKSTVAAMLVARGAALIDADVLAREAVQPGTDGLARVAAAFGQDVLAPDGSLDRKRLGAVIFGDEAARKELEGILHPVIRTRMEAKMAEHERFAPDKLLVVDIPLLYESGMDELFAAWEIMVVYIPQELQLKRLMERDGLSADAARQRLAAQLPIEAKRQRADIVIDNAGALEATAQQIDQFLRRKGLIT